jgi:glycosyltransferase involved in cell wall biosynthesis
MTTEAVTPSQVSTPASESPARLVSVVVPVRNAREDLSRCLDSLAQQTIANSLEIIVVDDGSDDGTPEVAEARGARVLRRNRGGAAAARNAGAAAARGEIVLYLDADCVADPGWAAALSEPLFANPSLAATVGRYESRQDSRVARFVQLELELRYDRMLSFGRIDFLNSGCCGFRRDVLERHPFDESYQRLEDVELSFRLSADGSTIQFAPDAWAYHRHPTRLDALIRRKFNYARYAPRLYRRYPRRAAADTSTPQSRRWRLVLLAATIACLPLALWHPAFLALAAVFAGGSLFLSRSTIRRGFGVSPGFGLAVLWYLLLGNLAFVLGTVRGMLPGRAPEAN